MESTCRPLAVSITETSAPRGSSLASQLRTRASKRPSGLYDTLLSLPPAEEEAAAVYTESPLWPTNGDLLASCALNLPTTASFGSSHCSFVLC